MVSGVNAAEFGIDSDCDTVPMGGSCTIAVSFEGQGPVGKKSATLAISSNDPKKPLVSVKLAGQVTAAAGSAFSTQDMAGTWLNSLLAAGDAPDNFGWLYSLMSYNAKGQLTDYSDITDSSLGTYHWTFTQNADLAIDSTGTVTAPNIPALANANIRGAINKGKNLSVLTGSYAPSDSEGVGNDNLSICVRKTGTFAAADLAGTWNFHTLSVGDGADANLWTYGTFTANPAGELTYESITRSSGDGTLPGADLFALAADGSVTSAQDSLHGIMSSDKSVIVFTAGDGGEGPYTLGVAVKEGAAAFTQADLTGTWVWHALGAEDAANFWFYGKSTADASGQLVFSSGRLSTGSSSVPATSGPTVVSSAGILTQAADTSFHGVMTPEKDVIFLTRDSNLVGSDTPSLWVGMKR